MRSAYPDPLLGALVCLGRLHGKTVNAESAVAGLPLEDGWLTPELFVRAAERAGFRAEIVRCRLNELHAGLLPAIVLTEDGFTLIVVRRNPDGTVEVLYPETGGGVETMEIGEVQRFSSGFVILAKPAYEIEDRARMGASTENAEPRSWFWGTLWSYRSFYGRVALATVFLNLLALAGSLFVMNVYDRVVPNHAQETLFVLAIGALIAHCFEFGLKSLRTYFVDRAGHRIDLKLGARLFEKILGMKYAHRPPSAGTLASQARSYESLREFFTSATVAALVDLPFVFVFAGFVYLLGGIVALPMAVGVLLALIVGFSMQFPLKRAVESSYQASNQRHALFVESISALETIKAARAESALQSRMERCVEVSSEADGKSRWYSQTALNVTAFLQQAVSVAIIVTAFYQIVDEKMTMGAMIACVILSGRGMAPMAMLASLVTRLQQSWRSFKGLNQIMTAPTERLDPTRRVALSEFEASVSLHEVTFAYPNAPLGTAALRALSLSVAPGEKVAVLGRVGSGKTSMLRLIPGLYQVEQGRVDVSGLDIRQVDPVELRRHIGFVTQDNALLYGTLRSNITAGNPWADEVKIWRALRHAGLEDFVRSHPEGLDLKISEGGRSLSGGQRQGVCIARALLDEPELLVFDEPTSSMDGLSEKAFIENIRAYLNEKPGRALVMATHKMSLLEIADRVVVLDEGRVVADGPKELVVRNLPRKAGIAPAPAPTPVRRAAPLRRPAPAAA
ncbi:MAG: type I secretion system permease/ATPase [Verrucomicrobiae bacterium]|nr:type I secretion system permease/ATPase [Verrucomicrobiae bacterium]MCP5541279.1 type I secretion system permease/ATPase [Akkermansiaceae bacterium]MCP5550944.1 type I secretion system permease/ATPase [Akkermansiaceae bacterium]